jgi:hypothetical protein
MIGKLFKGYDYPHYHRVSEILGILFFVLYSVLIIIDISPLVAKASFFNKLIFIFAIPCLSYITADFMSGMVHFLCDNFGTPETPYLGPSFIKSFRDHHTDPKGITRHDFIEVNGSNCIISLPFLALAYHTFDYHHSPWMLSFTIFLVFMLLFVFLTNQFHKWAHQDNPPALIKKLQGIHLILSPEHHSVHHTEPYDKYYCITCGWLNPVLSRMHFFERTEALLRKIFNSPKEMSGSELKEVSKS